MIVAQKATRTSVRAPMQQVATVSNASYRCRLSRGVARELRGRVDDKDQAQENNAETEGESEVAAARLQSNCCRHRPCHTGNVAADDQDRPYLGGGATDAGKHRREQAEPPEPQQ